jgi:LPS export ABC transporter permease LptG/LPS export ABC transporter permease LptF
VLKLKPARLTRYLLADLASPTLVAVLFFAFLLLMNQFFLIAREAIAKDLPAPTVARMLLYFFPQVLILSIPMATLLGTMIGIGRLSADHEWVALQSAGLGPGYLLRPILIHGAAATLVAFVTYAVFQPAAAYRLRQLTAETVVRTSLGADLKPRVFYDDIPGTVVYVSDIPAGGGGRLEGVLFYQSSARPGSGHEQVAVAREAYLRPSTSPNEVPRTDLKDGVSHSYRPNAPESYKIYRFGREVRPLQAPALVQALQRPPQRSVGDMTLLELVHERARALADPDPVIRPHRLRWVSVEMQQRFALPLACFLFAVLAMPLGMTRARTGKGAGFALSLLVILVYWVLFTSTRDQAVRGTVPPILGVWSGNFVIAAWALWAHLRLRWPSRAEREGIFARLLRVTRSAAGEVVKRIPRVGGSSPPAADGDDDFETEAEPQSSRSSSVLVTRLDQYVISLYAKIVLLALVAGYLLVGVVELKELMDGIVRRDESLILVARYFKYFAPGKLEAVLPVACLVGGLVCITVLGRTGELTAMKAGGMSALRLMMPVFGVTALLCVLFFLVQDRIAPITNRRAQEVRDQILGRAPRSYGSAPGGRWTFGSAGRVYHYSLYDPDRQVFQGLHVYTVDLMHPKISDHRFAATARWDGVAGTWLLEKGWYRSFPEESVPGEFRRFEGPEPVRLDPPENFSRREVSFAIGSDLGEQLSHTALARQIATLRDSGFDTTRLLVAYHAKFARPLTPLVMLLLGIPFAFRIGRRGSLYAVGVALGLVIVYWATFAVFHALGLETILPPVLAAWAPNVLYTLVGSYLALYIPT